MSYEYVLRNLLAECEGSIGVLFLDDSGETVDLACTERDTHDMQLLGAYVGIYLRQFRRFLESERLGEIELIQVESTRAHVFACPLADGYFLVLVQRGPNLAAVARRQLERAAALLMDELFEERRGKARKVDRISEAS